MTLLATDTLPGNDSYAKARFNMVESQIRTNRVTDPALLAALSRLPRQVFVPESLAGVAYVDKSLRIAGDRYLLEPLVLARLIQEAAVTPADKVLVVGAGTGYSTALIAGLAASVTGLECDAAFADRARANLDALEIANAVIQTGPLEQGWAASAPYDVILIDGMVGAVPAAITEQIRPSGRLVTIQSQEGRCGAGMLYRKLGGLVSGRILFDAAGPFLPGMAPRSAFAL